VAGFAEHDWRELAASGEGGAVQPAAIYMGVRAARFLSGRLLMHGAAADTPVTAIENVSRAEQKIVATTLDRLADALAEARIEGPAILFLGLSPRAALAAADDLDGAAIPASGGR
jgi:siroheme synthase